MLESLKRIAFLPSTANLWITARVIEKISTEMGTIETEGRKRVVNGIGMYPDAGTASRPRGVTTAGTSLLLEFGYAGTG